MENSNLDEKSLKQEDEYLDEHTLKSLKMKNTTDFKCLLVKPNNIKDYDYSDLDYIGNILDKEFCSFENMSFQPIEYMTNINKLLNVNNFDDPMITPHIITETENHTYEIIHIDLKNNMDENIKKIENQFGTLIDVSDTPIFGNVIIQKLYCPCDSNEMYYENITRNDIIELMTNRIRPKIVLYEDEEWREENLIGPIDIFSDQFLEEKSKYKKYEFNFLKHNISIWYLEDEYGELNVCGKLLNTDKKISKCIIFTKLNEEIVGNLTLNEVNKIIFLSDFLENYDVSNKDVEDEKDDIDRKIIKNKYRILHKYYTKYQNNNIE